MANKFFNKVLDMIGIEESEMEDEEMMEYEDDFNLSSEELEEPEETLVYTKNNRRNKVVDMPSTGNLKMVVYQPANYDDTQNIIDFLKARKPVVVNLEMLEIDVAQRVLDFISGAVYSLNGNIHKVSRGIFVLAPVNVDISGNILEENAMNSFYDMNGAAVR